MILKLLGLTAIDEERKSSLEKALTNALPEIDERSLRRITGLAGLLGKVAYADRDISTDEIKKIEEILRDSTHIPEQELELVTGVVARCTKELCGIEDHHYSRLLLESHEDKDSRLEILEVLFRVASSDGDICSEEDYVIGNIATALRLTRRDFINSRLNFKDYLSVLKNLPEG